MRRLLSLIFFLMALLSASVFAQEGTPFLSGPGSLEVAGNGLQSLAFVVRLEGVSEEVEHLVNYFVEDLPVENPPVFDSYNKLFYWRLEPGQAGVHTFKFTALTLEGGRFTKKVAVKVAKAPTPEALPRGWLDVKKEDKYLEGKKYFPATNIIDFDIAARGHYEIQVTVKDSMGEDCFLKYLPEEGNPEVYKIKNTAVIRIGEQYAGKGVKRIRRDLYEDLYNYLEMVFKNIEAVEITGDYFLEDCRIYDEKSLIAADGIENIDLPAPNISFDDRYYVTPLFSADNPISIADAPVIQVDFNTRSGLRWRKAMLRLDQAEYRAIKNDFTLVTVKPYKDITTFDVDYAMFMLRIPAASKLPFGEHHLVFEAENAYGMMVTREAYARVVSLPSQIVGKPMVYPNPFSPVRDGQADIQYELSIQTNIELIIFAVDGSVVTKKHFAMGEEGGKKGKNTVIWNGKTDAGLTVPNGIYSGVVIDKDENRILDRFKVTIFQ